MPESSSSHKPLLRSSSLLVAVLFLSAGVFTLGGCASVPSLAENPAIWVEIAKKRSVERWQLLLASQYDKAFAMYTTPSKANFDAAGLRAMVGGMRTKAANVTDATCNPEYCEVGVDITVTIRLQRVGLKQQVVPVRERWVVEDSELRLIRRQ